MTTSPTDAPGQSTTREMRLVDRLLSLQGWPGLAERIAERRLPGERWRTWQQIADELGDVVGETFTHAGVANWARNLGIPMDTERTDGEELEQAYRNQLSHLGIRLP